MIRTIIARSAGISLLLLVVLWSSVSCGLLEWPQGQREALWSLRSWADWRGGILTDVMVDYETGRMTLARELPILWVRTYNSEGSAQAAGVAIDSSGNIIVIGDADLGGADHYLLVKYAPSGEPLWQRMVDIGQMDRGAGIAVDRWNNLFIIGSSLSPGLGSHYYLAKFSPYGDLIWERAYKPGKSNRAFGVAVGPQGDIIVTGMCQLNGNYNYCTAKYDPRGRLLWERTYDGGWSDWPYGGAAVDPQGNIIVTGYTKPGPEKSIDYLTIKYSPQGDRLWVRSYDGGSSDEPRAIATDSQGNIIVAGMSYLEGTPAYYVIKYDPKGDELWARSYDTEGSDWATGVAIDSEDNVIIAGHTELAREIYPHLIKYSPSGDFIWSRSLRGGRPTRIYGVAVDSNGAVVAAGLSGTAEEGYDLYLVKLSDTGLYHASGSYLSPVHDFGRRISFAELTVEAKMNGQSIEILLEVSDNGFRSVKDSISIRVKEGISTYDITGLARARYMRVRVNLSTSDPEVTPVLMGLEVRGSTRTLSGW